MQANDYRLGYRADLEGLRAVAILLVVAAHAGVPWLAGGFVGVDVFFVLSGFLITGLLLQELGSRGAVRFGEFYVRRLRRLLPGLLAMVLVVGLFAAQLLAPGDQQNQAQAAASAVFWLSNIHFAFGRLDYFSSGAEGNLFLHTWSLGVEEQFYLVWPALVVWLWGRRGGGRPHSLRRLKIGMGTIVVGSLAACVAMTYAAPRMAFYMMPLRAWQFATGALVWLYLGKSGEALSVAGRQLSVKPIGWLGMVGIVVAAWKLTPDVPYPGAWALLPTLGTAAVIMAGVRGAGVASVLGWRPLQALGRVSYAWYLWHWPTLLLARALYSSNSPAIRAGAVLLSLALAVLSYRLVEAPTRHRRIWLARPRMTVVVALAVMSLAAVTCLRWYNRATDLNRSPQYVRLANAHADAPIIYGMGCDQWYTSDVLQICGFGSAEAHHTAILLGDSIAGQWFPAVARAYDKPDWRLLVLTKSSCPMVDEPIFYSRIGRMYKECATWRTRALGYLAGIKPDAVLVGSVYTYAFTPQQWIQGSSRILHALANASGQVYVLRSTPHLPFDGPDCLAAHQGRPTWLTSVGTCSAPAGSSESNAVFRWLQQASRPYANVSLIDLNDEICPNGVCQAERGGLVVFRDSQHMTASFAESLTGALASRLQQKTFAGN
jgi:peptidoglycan/LPS O-acetylase OafA/YrhL